MMNSCSISAHSRAGRLPLLILLSLAFSPLLRAQDTLELSRRVDAVISPSERAYFGLFPRIQGFVSALFVSRGDSSVAAVITRSVDDHRSDTSIMLSRHTFGVLGRYVNTFERRFYSDSAESDGGSIRGLARRGNDPTDDPLLLSIETAHKGTIQGALVYADDSVVVMGPDGFRADRDVSTTFLNVLVPGDIIHVSDRGDWFAHRFGEIDVPIGRNDTVYRAHLLEFLRSRGVYSPYLSPELLHVIQTADRMPHASIFPVVPVADFEKAHRALGLHLSFLAQVAGGSESAFFNSLEAVDMPGASFPIFGLEYDALPSLRIGLSYSWTSTTTVDSATLRDTPRNMEAIHGRTAMLTFRWMAIEAGRLKLGSSDRFDMEFGAGPVLQWLYRNIGFPSGEITRGTRWVLGGVACTGVRYYLSDRFSLDAEWRLVVYPSITMGSISTHLSYDVTLTRGELTLGFGVHL